MLGLIPAEDGGACGHAAHSSDRRGPGNERADSPKLGRVDRCSLRSTKGTALLGRPSWMPDLWLPPLRQICSGAADTDHNSEASRPARSTARCNFEFPADRTLRFRLSGASRRTPYQRAV